MTAPPQPQFHLIVVLSRPTEWAGACLAAAFSQSLPPAQVTLVDNRPPPPPGAPAADTAAWRAAFPALRVIDAPPPLGFAACCNRAAAATRRADLLLLLDVETVLSQTALAGLAAAFAAAPSAAVMGCKVLGGDVETIAHLGSAMRGNGLPSHVGRGERDEGQYTGVRDALSVPAAALAVRAEVWCELGGLDESFWPAHFEVADLCFRARAALWRVAVACEATATCFGPQPPDGLTGPDLRLFFDNRARFLRKHYRPADWLKRYAPEEARWLLNGASKGMKSAALKATLAGLFHNKQTLPQTIR